MFNKVAIIQARMGSTRLPGKVMKNLAGKPVLEHCICRVQQARLVDNVIVATTTNAGDNVIVDFCKEVEVNCFRGSEEDVLARYYLVAKKYKADIVVRITSDCPLIDPDVIDAAIDLFLSDTSDYVSNTLKRTFPRGLDTEVFWSDVLERAFYEAEKNYEREHVTPYIWQHPDKFKLGQLLNEVDYSGYRLTLDTEEDYLLLTELFNRASKPGEDFNLNSIIKFLIKNPEVTKINAHVKQKKLGE